MFFGHSFQWTLGLVLPVGSCGHAENVLCECLSYCFPFCSMLRHGGAGSHDNSRFNCQRTTKLFSIVPWSFKNWAVFPVLVRNVHRYLSAFWNFELENEQTVVLAL